MSDKEVRTGLRQMWGGLLIAMSLVVLLSLATYESGDIGIMKAPPNASASNCFGPAGAWLSYILLVVSGLAAFVVPVWMFVFGLFLVIKPESRLWPRLLAAILFMVSLSSLFELNAPLWQGSGGNLNILPAVGGILSHAVTRWLARYLTGAIGTAILAWLGLIASSIAFVGPSSFVVLYEKIVELWDTLMGRVEERRANTADEQERVDKEERGLEKERRRLERTAVKAEKQAKKERKEQDRRELEEQQEKERRERAEEEKHARAKKVKEKAEKKAEVAVEGSDDSVAASVGRASYELPPITLLDELPVTKERKIESDTVTTGRILCSTLEEFGVETEIANVEQGPVVTRYELRPAAGVRVERIAGLANNLALALKATSVRVQAPVPGKGVVGVEVPNATSSMVYLREILEGEVWAESTAALPLALGKDVGGNDVVGDLAAMPHLLIAGATGAGKTICLNSLLIGLLMRRTPDQLRLMLVDPKIVEFSAYNHLPHLVVPVITDPHKVTLGLRWAIDEMEKRYKLFAKAGVRNIDSYNNRKIETPQDLFEGEDGEAKDEFPRTLPYIVIAVDELADLMLVAQSDIENCIARLAQLSRAVGIHMILATQRPSVNVITGTIKANFPARIAFQVAQRVDSRTILDANGADKLLGRGDMLFVPPGSNRLIRAQGALVTDPEGKRVVDFIKNQGGPAYDVAIHEKIKSVKKTAAGGLDSGEDDALLEQAIEIIRETRRASTSSLQRRLRIGYTRAARMMDILEDRGIVGPPRGSDPREILLDLDGEIPSNAEEMPAEEEAQVETDDEV